MKTDPFKALEKIAGIILGERERERKKKDRPATKKLKKGSKWKMFTGP